MTNETNEDLVGKLEDKSDQEILANINPALMNLVEGYLDYATYVILQRAIVGIDGFKPVQRRALYTAKFVTKLTSLKKSAKFVGDVLSIHPHGDAPVYQAVARMVEGARYLQTPYFTPSGAFGTNDKGTKPADPRYTTLKLNDFAEELFKDMSGIKMIPTEDGNYKEPELLPVPYPSVFANATSGIAVGLSANIFPYPLSDYCNYTADLIEKGESDILLIPEFETDGYIVNTPKEFAKIMRTGKGRIKLRGNWHIKGKEIVITEFPYYTDTPTIVKQINKLEHPQILEVIDSSDMTSGAEVVVRCRKPEYVESVLHTLIRETDIQMYATSNVVVIVDGQPKIAGVEEITKDWIKFREDVLTKSLTNRLSYIKDLQNKYRIYLDLTSNKEYVDKLVEVLKVNEKQAEELLHQWYPNITEEIVTWLLGLTVRRFYNPTKNKDSLQKLEQEQREIEYDLANIGKVIVKQLRKYARDFKRERVTKLTDVDYSTTKETEEDAVLPVEVLITDKFITKRTYNPAQAQAKGSFRCQSDDIIIAVDTHGRIIRVDLKRIDYTVGASRGVYLPVYLEVEDDFNLVWATVLDDKKVSFLYNDGKASVLDLKEWIDLRNTRRIIPQGVSPEARKICGLINLDAEYLIVVTSDERIGITTTDFKQKGRTSRTSLFRMNANTNETITHYYSVSSLDIVKIVRNAGRYMDKLRMLEYPNDFDFALLRELAK